MNEPRRFQIRLSLSVLLIVSTLMLSGCARPVRGQSMASAEAAINAVEGLSGTTDSGGTYAGWVYQRWSGADVTLEAGYEVTQWEDLFVWLVQLSWSLNDDKPNRGVLVSMRFADRTMFARWQEEEDHVGLPKGHSLSKDELDSGPMITVTVPARFAGEAGLGKWPGEVPVLPENVVVKIANE